MSSTSGCKIALLVVVVAAFAGMMGFASGFATHALVVASGPPVLPAVVEISNTPAPTQAVPSPALPAATVPVSAAEPTPERTPAPTVAIPPATGTTFDLFWEAWSIVQRDYYGDLPSEQELTYGAIRGATEVLGDPYTAFVEPAAAEHRRLTEGGSYEGIGALVTMEDGQLIIVEPFKDQPADKAGVLPGDVVLKVDDTAIQNLSLYEAIDLILGPAGSTVRLTIQREGQEPFEVTIVRAHIDVPMVESSMRDDGIAYVSLFSFDGGATDKLKAAIDELLAQNPKGLILDLRGNPGGFLNESVLTAGLFLPRDDVILIERSKTEETSLAPKDYGAGDPLAPDIPMVVLVNGGSASASEIVAGALQDYGRAVLIGEKTFGKGSVQLIHELSNGAELRVTTARWFTPKDRAIHGAGLEPDIAVDLTQADAEVGLDPQLDRAVEYLLTGK
jgi:carboxyl-terminal processing protease